MIRNPLSEIIKRENSLILGSDQIIQSGFQIIIHYSVILIYTFYKILLSISNSVFSKILLILLHPPLLPTDHMLLLCFVSLIILHWNTKAE